MFFYIFLSFEENSTTYFWDFEQGLCSAHFHFYNQMFFSIFLSFEENNTTYF